MRNRWIRLAPPILLILAGVAALIGCIPIPVYQKVGGGRRPETNVGSANSSRPLKIGQSTRDDVLRVLGPPNGGPSKQPDNALVYVYLLNTIFWFPCFQDVDARFLRLEFDERGALRKYRVLTSREEAFAP